MWETLNFRVITIPSSDIARITAEFTRAGITNYQIREFQPAAKTTNDGTNTSFLGIMAHNNYDSTAENLKENHMKLIEEAYVNGLPWVAIAEDDVEFATISPEKEKRISEWMTEGEWDMLYFGHCPWPWIFSLPSSRDIVRTFSPLTTHCYVISRSGMEIALQHRGERKHIDKLFATMPGKKYACYPDIATQPAPALYKKAHVPLKFSTCCFVLQTLAYIMPLLLCVVCTLIVLWGVRKMRKSAEV